MHDPHNSNRKRISKFSQGLSTLIAIVTILATTATIIGNAFGNGRISWIEHKAAHLFVGGAAGAILSDDHVKGAASGATAAVAAEMLMEAMAPTYNDFSEQTRLNRPHLSDHEMRGEYENHLRSLAAVAKFAASSTGLAFGNVNTAFNTADNAVENNAMPSYIATTAIPVMGTTAGLATGLVLSPAVVTGATALAVGVGLGYLGHAAYIYFANRDGTYTLQEYPGRLMPDIEAFPDHNGLIPPFRGGFQPYDQPQRPSILYTPLNPVKLWQDQGLSIPIHYPAFNEGFQAWKGGNPMGVLMNEGQPLGTKTNKNSLKYIGETHVYVIKRERDQQIIKIGESAQGVRKSDGASIRAEQQARRLQRETGERYETAIRQTYGSKREAREAETTRITKFRGMFGRDTLPGNKTNR